MKKGFFIGYLMLIFTLLRYGMIFAEEDICRKDSFFPDTYQCGYDTQTYHLNMQWEAKNDFWIVSEIMTFITLSDSDFLLFDFTAKYDISELRINGSEADYERAGNVLKIFGPFIRATEYHLEAVFSGVLDYGMFFDQTGTHRAEDGSFCTIDEPNNTYRYFICNDHPRDKALFDYSFTVPAGYDIAGTGLLKQINEADGKVINQFGDFSRSAAVANSEGTVTYTFEVREPMAPYLFIVCAGHYDTEVQILPNGIQKADFIQTETENTDRAHDLTKLEYEVIAFIENALGPYPYSYCGSIFGAIHSNTNIEAQGRPFFAIESATDETIFVHEILHQWIGDLISIDDWSDVWIKEGAAKYWEALWILRKHGQEAYEKVIVDYYQTVKNSAGPKQINNSKESLYGVQTYQAAALVYYSLHQKLGDELFFKAMRHLIDKYRFGTVSTEQFIKSFNESAGADLTNFINNRLYYEPDRLPDLPGIIIADEVPSRQSKDME